MGQVASERVEHVIEGCQCEGKRCRACKDVLCHGNFGPDKRLESGLRSECYACRKKSYHANAEANRQRAREYRKLHAQEIAERDKQHRLATPEHEKSLRRAQYLRNVEHVKAKRKAYREDHPEAVKLQKKRHVQTHREQINAKQRRYYRNNTVSYLEMSRARFARRRTRKSQAGGTFTKQQWQELKAYYGNRCLCCGRSDVKLTPDHVIPVAKDGSSDISNIQPLCLPCNLSKGTKIIDYRR